MYKVKQSKDVDILQLDSNYTTFVRENFIGEIIPCAFNK